MKTLLILLIALPTLLNAQDSTISRAFKSTKPQKKYPLIKAKYPSYQLLTGFLLVQEANGGDPYAQHELGLRYLIGKGFSVDTIKAVSWIKKAVDQNLSFARFNYAIMLNNGIGVEWNPFKAYQHFKFAANSGIPAGQFAYGTFYTDNLVVNRNYINAYKWIKMAANGGFEPAKDALEQFKNSGFSFSLDSNDVNNNSNTNEEVIELSKNTEIIEQDWELDFFDFEDDSLNEDEEINAIKEILNRNTKKLKKLLGISELINENDLKDTTAIELINFAANSGSPEALLIAGRGFEKGIVLEKDLVKATMNYLRSLRLGSRKAAENLVKLIRSERYFELLKERIDEGDPNAMYAWAGLVALGFDYRLTSEQALDLLIKAGNQNHLQSIVETGLCYYNGNLVDQDKEKAYEYWTKASELGSIEAKVRLAFSKISEYIDGNDISKEIKILKQSSQEGSVLAQSALAYCYEKGIGVYRNKPEAVKLYRNAAQRGNMAAYNSLKRMYDEIRPDNEEYVIYSSE